MSDYRTLDDLEPRGQRVLLRADLNVPMRDGRVTDATRIERTAPTIRELMDRGARVVVLSHLGRPRGERVADLSLRPLVEPLSQALGGAPVAFADDCIGEAARDAVDGLGDGDVALLENLRFHAGEERNDPDFVDALAALGDLYVNDAFSAAHRAHASTEGVAHRLPAAAGRLMQAELDALTAALERPQHPVAAVIGGAKVSTKLEVLGHLVDRVDQMIIGGAMANTFLFARNATVGRSLHEPELAPTCREIESRARTAGCELVLPLDAVVAPGLDSGADSHAVGVNSVPDAMMIVDVGPATVTDLTQRLDGLKTLLWNGPLGAFETPPFDRGTVAVARAAAERTAAGALLSVAGGGDTVAALAAAGVAERFSYVSTAGGAFLEWLEGKTLPGVAALRRDPA